MAMSEKIAPNLRNRRQISKAAFRTMLPLLFALAQGTANAQVENAPSGHPVHRFLRKMEVAGHIQRYNNAVLPMSREEIAGHLAALDARRGDLSEVEAERLDDFLREFAWDLGRGTAALRRLFGPGEESFGERLEAIVGNDEKYLAWTADTGLTLFANGLLAFDARGTSQELVDGSAATYLQAGIRLRGMLGDHVGYYFQATNAQFWGSRTLLAQDPQIAQSYALSVENASNFDFLDATLRARWRFLAGQLGRERVLVGTSVSSDMKMVASDNVRVYDFIRGDVDYAPFRYTFIHGSLLGRPEELVFTFPSDTLSEFTERTNADKYYAAHRLELSFPRLFTVGAQEMVVYSNRAPDLAYLTPLTFIESAQRARDERDNVFWVFDLETHVIDGLSFVGTLLFDDIDFTALFSDSWTSRWAYQAGVLWSDPLGLPDLMLGVEYTRVEPYVFSHPRSRENDYGSLGAILGPRIGPNADSWQFVAEYAPLRNLFLAAGVGLERQGENTVAPDGRLLINAGGDFMQPHRGGDPETKVFLGGIRFSTTRLHLSASWEVANQIWVEGLVRSTNTTNETNGGNSSITEGEARLRMEF